MTRQFAIVGILAWGVGLGWVPPTKAQDSSPVQYARDGASTLIQKDLDGMEWTITYHVETGRVTGNVRGMDGSSTFLDCDRTGLAGGVGTFECFAADGCPASPCESQPWSPVGEVELPTAFFLPEAGEEPDPLPELGCCSFASGPCFDGGPSPQSCVATGGSFTFGTSCTVVGPLEDCPEGLPPEMCFVGRCE